MRSATALLIASFCFAAAWFDGAARACSPPCGATVLPAAGDVPANLPGLFFSYQGPALGVPADEAIVVTEVLPDGSEATVPLTVESTIGTQRLARFGRALTPGATYRVAVASGCNSGEPWSVTSFQAVAPAPLPAELGTVRVGAARTGSRKVWTTSGSCTAPADIVSRTLTLELAPDAVPWVQALQVQWWRDDGLVASILSAAREDEDPAERWRTWASPTLYHVCDAADDGVDPGMPEGTTVVHARGQVPGGVSTLSTRGVDVALDCGCGAGTGSRTAFLAAIAILAMLRVGRRSAARRGRGHESVSENTGLERVQTAAAMGWRAPSTRGGCSMARQGGRIGVVVGVVGLVGCGGSEPTNSLEANAVQASEVPLSELSAKVMETCRASSERCACASGLGPDEGDETCTAVEEYELGQEIARVSEMVQRGAVTFDRQAAATCLDALANTSCEVDTLACGGFREVLWRSVAPAVPLGGACASSFECAEGACGREDGNAAFGTCVPAGEGDPCVVWCGDGVSFSADGAAPASCMHVCVDNLSMSGPWDACTCERMPREAAAVGEACADAASPCVDEAWCDLDADLCKPRGELGASCVDTFAKFVEQMNPKWLQASCVDGLYCEPSTSTCVLRKPPGVSCDPQGFPGECVSSCGPDERCRSALCL